MWIRQTDREGEGTIRVEHFHIFAKIGKNTTCFVTILSMITAIFLNNLRRKDIESHCSSGPVLGQYMWDDIKRKRNYKFIYSETSV